MLAFDQIIHIGETLVAVAGLIVAYQVFFLQAKTFSRQQDVTNLEYKKFLYQIRPVFNIVEVKKTTTMPGGSIMYSLDIKLIKNVAIKISLVDNSDPELKQMFVPEKIPFLNENLVITVFSGFTSIESLEKKCNVIINFEDEVGTKYKQEIFGDGQNPQISPSLSRDESGICY